jgi:hypothetical protein
MIGSINESICANGHEFDRAALWGNFPQTHSITGLIFSAMRLSRCWEERGCRG